MCIDLFCLIHPGKVNLEKELPFWMLPLLSPCVTSTLSLSPSELRTSLNPGHWVLARVVLTGVISLQDCLWPGCGEETRNDLSAYRAEVTACCRGTRLKQGIAACRPRCWSHHWSRFLLHPGASIWGFEWLLSLCLCKGSAGII